MSNLYNRIGWKLNSVNKTFVTKIVEMVGRIERRDVNSDELMWCSPVVSAMQTKWGNGNDAKSVV